MYLVERRADRVEIDALDQQRLAGFEDTDRQTLARPDRRREERGQLLELFGIGYSWGGYESLIIPADPAPIRKAAPWPASDRGVRLSIGLEDPADLIADLDRAVAAMSRT